MREHLAPPSASILVESIRDIGYSTESAMADIIDNSITAGATTIRIFATRDEVGFHIAILDNGHGMSEEELLKAMQLGSTDPRQLRDAGDLGRFGLGLKTASFSQCRRLTVVSRRNGDTAVGIWDLDYVSQRNDWVVQIPEDTSDVPYVDLLGETGTVVVWQKLDRILVDSPDQIQQSHSFDAALVSAEEHLALVFHRFLSHEPRLPSVDMFLNNGKIEPFDPFFTRHKNTHFDPPDPFTFNGYKVTLQAFTLPRRKWVTEAEWKKYGGREGYLRNQGIYLYRAGRLIIHGTWFRLARQDELTKLCRVKMDMPNALDSLWHIDVKKSSAQLPPKIRDWIRGLLDRLLERPKKVVESRGSKSLDESSTDKPWLRVEKDGFISYRLNPDYVLFSDFASRLEEPLRDDFARLVSTLESALPVKNIYVDYAKDPHQIEDEAQDSVAPVTFREFARGFISQRLAQGMEREDLEVQLKMTSSFSKYWKDTVALLDQLEQETDVGNSL